MPSAGFESVIPAMKQQTARIPGSGNDSKINTIIFASLNRTTHFPDGRRKSTKYFRIEGIDCKTQTRGIPNKKTGAKFSWVTNSISLKSISRTSLKMEPGAGTEKGSLKLRTDKASRTRRLSPPVDIQALHLKGVTRVATILTRLDMVNIRRRVSSSPRSASFSFSRQVLFKSLSSPLYVHRAAFSGFVRAL